MGRRIFYTAGFADYYSSFSVNQNCIICFGNNVMYWIYSHGLVMTGISMLNSCYHYYYHYSYYCCCCCCNSIIIVYYFQLLLLSLSLLLLFHRPIRVAFIVCLFFTEIVNEIIAVESVCYLYSSQIWVSSHDFETEEYRAIFRFFIDFMSINLW